MTLVPPEPLILDRPGVIRWAVRAADGKRSLTWSVITNPGSDDVYIGSRSMLKDVKLSLHASGCWRMALTEQTAAARLAPGEDRVFSRWSPGVELAFGWRTAVWIQTPSTTFTAPFAEREPKGSRIVWWDAPSPPEVMSFVVLLGAPDHEALTVNDVVGDVGRITLTSGMCVWIIATTHFYDDTAFDAFEQIKAQARSHPEANSGYAWGHSDDGLPFVLDLASVLPHGV